MDPERLVRHGQEINREFSNFPSLTSEYRREFCGGVEGVLALRQDLRQKLATITTSQIRKKDGKKSRV